MNILRFLIIAIIFIPFAGKSQDLIILKDKKDTIKCKIVEDRISYIKYKRFNSIDTSIYIINQNEFDYFLLQKQDNKTDAQTQEQNINYNIDKLITNEHHSEYRDSKVIIYRPKNLQGFAINFKIKVNDTLTIKIRNSSYYEFTCNPGDYNFTFQKYINTKLHLHIEGGKTYYLRVGLVIGFWSSSPELLVLDSISAIPELKNGKIQKLKSTNEILIRPKNRIGANLISSSGFGGWNAFTFPNGVKSIIRFGSGYGYEFLLGREFNRWLDISTGLIHLNSSLTPKVENAEITFERYALSITPAYIIQIQDGDFQRLKLGFGVDYVFPSLLVINTIKYTNGINDRWDYDATYGFHIGLIYEFNFTKHFSMQYGIKYSKKTYQFIKGNKYYPIVEELVHPDGSGIEMQFGLNIHF